MPRKRKITYLTADDRARKRVFEAATAEQFGDLHQRMKWLIDRLVDAEEAQRSKDEKKFAAAFSQINVAVYDLATEVSYHVPQQPPFGQRFSPLSSRK